jgi:hypothetical protein
MNSIVREAWYKTIKSMVYVPSLFKSRLFTEKIRPFRTVYGENMVVYDLRFSPYISDTVTEIYDRNTGQCNTEKYGSIRSSYQATWVFSRMLVHKAAIMLLFKAENANEN